MTRTIPGLQSRLEGLSILAFCEGTVTCNTLGCSCASRPKNLRCDAIGRPNSLLRAPKPPIVPPPVEATGFRSLSQRYPDAKVQEGVVWSASRGTISPHPENSKREGLNSFEKHCFSPSPPAPGAFAFPLDDRAALWALGGSTNKIREIRGFKELQGSLARFKTVS